MIDGNFELLDILVSIKKIGFWKWFTFSDEEAIFALANQTEGITLVKLGSMKGIVTVHTLKASSYLGRLWDNIGGKLWSFSV